MWSKTEFTKLINLTIGCVHGEYKADLTLVLNFMIGVSDSTAVAVAKLKFGQTRSVSGFSAATDLSHLTSTSTFLSVISAETGPSQLLDRNLQNTL